MDQVFIDANIFLEVQLNQEKSEDCKALLRYLEKARNLAWTNSFLVFSMIITIQHKTGDLEKCKKLVNLLNSYQGLNVYNSGLFSIFNALEMQKNSTLDFDDALVLTSMDQLKISKLVSFDSDFEKIEDIELLTPKQALRFLKKQ